MPLDRPLTLGRSPACDICLQEPSVSRSHARIVADEAAVMLQDAGSSYGTFLDGRQVHDAVPLAPGMAIELGDARLEVVERSARDGVHRTVSVPAGISLVVAQPGVRRTRLRGQRIHRPRMRSGWSLKRLDAGSGDREEHSVLRDDRSGAVIRLPPAEADLLRLLDGEHDLVDLIGEATVRCGPDGPARLARLLAELADRGLLAGVEQAPAPAGTRIWPLRGLRTRERELPWVPGAMSALYRRGAWRLFTRSALVVLAAIAVLGLAAFVALITGRHGTPFVVARRVGLGALVFVLGRLALVVCHELAHGLLAESFGRPVGRAGIKLVFVFPYVFVDTTDAWFESRGRRMAISLAGPVSDLVLGGAFALGCWAAAPGGARDVLFQVALGGYVGALFNLNPLMERDGYHVLVDALGMPGLRRRAARRLHAALSGRGGGAGDRALLAYGVASLVWSAVTVAFGVLMSLRYYRVLADLAPPALVWTVLCAFYLVLALPLAAGLLHPLWSRVQRARPSAAAR